MAGFVWPVAASSAQADELRGAIAPSLKSVTEQQRPRQQTNAVPDQLQAVHVHRTHSWPPRTQKLKGRIHLHADARQRALSAYKLNFLLIARTPTTTFQNTQMLTQHQIFFQRWVFMALVFQEAYHAYAYITIAIRLRYDYDEKLTWHIHFSLASNWKQGRAMRRSRIVVESQLYISRHTQVMRIRDYIRFIIHTVIHTVQC